jgi:hypothetical protein
VVRTAANEGSTSATAESADGLLVRIGRPDTPGEVRDDGDRGHDDERDQIVDEHTLTRTCVSCGSCIETSFSQRLEEMVVAPEPVRDNDVHTGQRHPIVRVHALVASATDTFCVKTHFYTLELSRVQKNSAQRSQAATQGGGPVNRRRTAGDASGRMITAATSTVITIERGEPHSGSDAPKVASVAARK